MTVVPGSEAMMEILRAEGVHYVFGLPGATEMHFMDALQDCADITYILSLHECGALGMAEGYARASGKIGFVNLHTGAGLGAAIPLLINAHAGGVPLVVTAGQQYAHLLMQEPPLGEYNLTHMVDQLTKWSTEVTHSNDLPLAMRRAFKVAQTPPCGPVFVSLPQNVMEQSLDFNYPQGASLFTGLKPDKDAVQTAANLLLQAQASVIVVGWGVTKNSAHSNVVKLAELMGAPVYQPHAADVDFPFSHAQFLGGYDEKSLYASQLADEIDTLIIIGASQTEVPGALLRNNPAVIQCDDDPWQIAKNFPVNVGIQGNIGCSVADLVECISTNVTPPFHEAVTERIRAVTSEKMRIKEAFQQKARLEKDQHPISPSRLMMELREAVNQDTIIVDDSWSCSDTLRHCIAFDKAGQYYRFRGGGSIGWGMSGGLGVKLAFPDRQVVTVTGDGSAMWGNQSLWTAARYNIPVTYIVCANSCFQYVKSGKIRRMGERAHGRFLGMEFVEPRIAFWQLAEAMGIYGRRVDDPQDLTGVLRTAFDLNAPALIEVSIA